MLSRLHIKTVTFLLFAITLALLAIVHNLATAFFLYWHYLWLDIPVHALGGSVVALGYLVVSRVHERWHWKHGLGATIAVVFGVGMLWELYEWGIGVYATESAILGDTALDMLMNLIGATIGFYVAYALRSLDAQV